LQYFRFALHSLLGPDYTCVHSAESATGDCSIVLCRSALRGRVSCMDWRSVLRPGGQALDPERLKRMQLASLAHRRAALTKESDLLASPLRRRGTVDLQKELSQMGHTFSLRIDDGPRMRVFNLWDPSLDMPINIDDSLSFYTGLFRDPGPPQVLDLLSSGVGVDEGRIAVQRVLPDVELYAQQFVARQVCVCVCVCVYVRVCVCVCVCVCQQVGVVNMAT
jgi:hypothetical protein